MTSWRHLADFLNQQFLIGPFALYAFIPAAWITLRSPERRSRPAVFLLTAGFSYLAVSILANDSNLGYARNWDLLAPAGIAFSSAALYFLFRQVQSSPFRLSRLLGFACIAAALHTLPWLWVNHHEQLAFDRFRTLPLGMGRTELVAANWHLRNQRPEKGAEWLRRSLEKNPDNGPAFALLGMILTEQGKYQQASQAYSRAVQLREDKLEYRNNYMMTLLKLGRDQAALEQLDILTGMKPGNSEYWAQMAGVLIRLSGEGAGTQLIGKLLRENRGGDAGEAAEARSAAYLLLLGREEASVKIRSLLESGMNNCHAAAFLGALLEAREDADRAGEFYSIAVKRCPENNLYRDMYATVLLQQEDYEQALEQLEVLARSGSDEVRYLEMKAELLSRLDRPAESKSAYRRLLRISEKKLESDPGDETANIRAGTYLMILNRPEEALQRFRRALESNPGSLAGIFNIGTALLNMGRTEEAREYLTRFVQLYPDHPKAEYARRQLRRISR
jgi:tetratricopeptide (TPR) repeat protein